MGGLRSSTALLPSNPQAYATEALARAERAAAARGIETQTLWELLLNGQDIHVIKGEEANHKITTAQDWEIMQKVTFPRWLSENAHLIEAQDYAQERSH